MSFAWKNTWPFTYFDANTTNTGLSAIDVRQQDVLWLEISVDYSFAVQNSHGSCNLMQKYSDSIFTESSFNWQKKSHINF